MWAVAAWRGCGGPQPGGLGGRAADEALEVAADDGALEVAADDGAFEVAADDGALELVAGKGYSPASAEVPRIWRASSRRNGRSSSGPLGAAPLSVAFIERPAG